MGRRFRADSWFGCIDMEISCQLSEYNLGYFFGFSLWFLRCLDIVGMEGTDNVVSLSSKKAHMCNFHPICVEMEIRGTWQRVDGP